MYPSNLSQMAELLDREYREQRNRERKATIFVGNARAAAASTFSLERRPQASWINTEQVRIAVSARALHTDENGERESVALHEESANYVYDPDSNRALIVFPPPAEDDHEHLPAIEALQDVSIRPDMAFLVRNLQSWYANTAHVCARHEEDPQRELSPGERQRLAAAERLLSVSAPNARRRTAKDEPRTPTEVVQFEHLNAAQNNSLAAAADANLYLWGPPGTGKTETLAAHAAQALANGHTLLISANTHRAIDELAARCATSPASAHAFARLAKQGKIARLGESEHLSAETRALCAEHGFTHGLRPQTRVVIATAHAAHLNARLHEAFPDGFDVALVDEATMLTPPLAWYAASLGKRSRVLAGDPRQTQPIVALEREKKLATNCFAAAGVMHAGAGSMVMLNEQHRTNRSIMGLLNAVAYADNGRSLTMPEGTGAHHKQPREHAGALEDHAVVFIDTGPMSPWAVTLNGTSLSKRGGSVQCPAEASIVKRVLDHLDPERTSAESIRVLSPFRAQTALIKDAVRVDHPQRTEAVTTVHRSQGSEADNVVFCTTETNGRSRLAPFLAGRSMSDPNGAVMTVGLSRAVKRLIIVGHRKHLLDKAPAGGHIHRMFEYLDSSPDAVQLDPFSLYGERFSWEQGKADVAGAVIDDIDNASRAITVLTSRAEQVLQGDIGDALGRARRRGLNLTVATIDPLRETFTEEQHQRDAHIDTLCERVGAERVRAKPETQIENMLIADHRTVLRLNAVASPNALMHRYECSTLARATEQSAQARSQHRSRRTEPVRPRPSERPARNRPVDFAALSRARHAKGTAQSNANSPDLPARERRKPCPADPEGHQLKIAPIADSRLSDPEPQAQWRRNASNYEWRCTNPQCRVTQGLDAKERALLQRNIDHYYVREGHGERRAERTAGAEL